MLRTIKNFFRREKTGSIIKKTKALGFAIFQIENKAVGPRFVLTREDDDIYYAWFFEIGLVAYGNNMDECIRHSLEMLHDHILQLIEQKRLQDFYAFSLPHAEIYDLAYTRLHQKYFESLYEYNNEKFKSETEESDRRWFDMRINCVPEPVAA